MIATVGQSMSWLATPHHSLPMHATSRPMLATAEHMTTADQCMAKAAAGVCQFMLQAGLRVGRCWPKLVMAG
jgi:hypothetical protein